MTVNTSEKALVELERLHDRKLVNRSLKTWQALTKAIEKEDIIFDIVIYIKSFSDAWRAPTKFTAEMQEAAYDRAKSEFESLELLMLAAAASRLEAEPVAEAAMADAPLCAAVVVDVAASSMIIQNRCTQGSNSAHSTIDNSRPHCSKRSGDICSCSSGDIRSTSSAISGSAGLDHLPNSTIEVVRLTSGDNNIREEIRHIGTSRARANAAMRRSTFPQSAG